MELRKGRSSDLSGVAAKNPTILSAALFERDGRVLTAHRKIGCPPFAGQWLLPMTPVRPAETAEDAVKRYTGEQFGVQVAREAFVDTVYVEDPDDQTQYIANIFRAELAGGPMRFRADGDYDDARWLAASELDQLWMPPALREPLVRIMTDPEYAPGADWAVGATQDAAPLAERAEEQPPAPERGPAALPPDNRSAWDAIAKAYQEEFYGERAPARLRWTPGVYEDDLHLLEGVRGKRAIVLGCGGGGDCVALERMGAVVIGVDVSSEQIAHARRYAAKHGSPNASFVGSAAEDLSRFDDASFDLVISIHTLRYVENAGRAIAEAARVLRSSGVLIISEPHPCDQVLSASAPFRAERSYFSQRTPYIDWNWDEEKFNEKGRLRDWRRTVSEWFELLVNAGFAVERIVEPYQGDMSGEDAESYDMERIRLMPHVLIIKARKR